MNVKIKRLENNAIVPSKATSGSCAYDVYAPADFLVNHGRSIVPLNIAIELPQGYEAKIEPRSGYSAKGFAGFSSQYSEKETRYNCDVIVGKIDSDYRGNVGVIIKNDDAVPFWIHRGQRIAQLTVYKVEDVEFTQTDSLSETKRGEGGFGHTNI